jgi:serine/threonine-protein kinase
MLQRDRFIIHHGTSRRVEIVTRCGSKGEVWKARDTRLRRDIAIKALYAECPTDVQLRERFEREAKTIKRLRHPHISLNDGRGAG